MMEIRLHPILTASIVYFRLTLVQPLHQVADQAVTGQVNGESEVQDNFQNLLDSIMKNEPKKSELYHENLMQEITREQQAFDTMKEELWMARNKDARRKRYFYKKSYTGENTAAVKRETRENNLDNENDPEKLEREANKKFEEMKKERKEADILRNQSDRFQEMSSKMRRKAANKDQAAAMELVNEADDLVNKAKNVIPERVEKKRRKAADLNQEVEELRRRAENIRSDKQSEDDD